MRRSTGVPRAERVAQIPVDAWTGRGRPQPVLADLLLRHDVAWRPTREQLRRPVLLQAGELPDQGEVRPPEVDDADQPIGVEERRLQLGGRETGFVDLHPRPGLARRPGPAVGEREPGFAPASAADRVPFVEHLPQPLLPGVMAERPVERDDGLSERLRRRDVEDGAFEVRAGDAVDGRQVQVDVAHRVLPDAVLGSRSREGR